MAVADILAAIGTQLPDVEQKFGSRYLHEHAAPPRIIFVPLPDLQDSFGGASKSMHVPGAKHGQRALKTWQAHVRCYVWAVGLDVDEDPYKDLRAAEALTQRFLNAVHQVCYGFYELVRGGFEDQGVADLGVRFIVDIKFDVPIAEPAATAPTVTTFTDVNTMTGTADFPASDVTDTPAP